MSASGQKSTSARSCPTSALGSFATRRSQTLRIPSPRSPESRPDFNAVTIPAELGSALQQATVFMLTVRRCPFSVALRPSPTAWARDTATMGYAPAY
jgi:hypothetical protein